MLNKFISAYSMVFNRIGYLGIFELIIYPVLTPVYSFVAWIKTLWKSRVLLDGEWKDYRGFHPQNAMNSFFYKTQWTNIERYGLHGKSPVIGLGDYPLNRWFHISLLSNYIYANAGAVTTLLSTLFWSVSYLAWIDVTSSIWVLIIVTIILFSSTSYAMAFARQNYNMLSWMWIPFGIFAMTNEYWVVAAIMWFLASLFSITTIILMFPLLAIYSISEAQWLPVLSMAPSLLKVSLHFVPVLTDIRRKSGFIDIAKTIGVSGNDVKYKRTTMRIDYRNLYFIFIYVLGILFLYIENISIILPVAALVIFIINQRIVRIADEQSVILLFFSIYCVSVLSSANAPYALLGLFIVANPVPLLLGLCSTIRDKTAIRIPALKPFNHSELEKNLDNFFSVVSRGEKVIIAFDDPRGVYGNIFDGYRYLIELPFYIAVKNEFHLFPDWYAVIETNNNNAPNIWGRSVDAVTRLVDEWECQYVIVYQDTGTDLDMKWKNAGFKIISSFDWAESAQLFDGFRICTSVVMPKWWMLKTN